MSVTNAPGKAAYPIASFMWLLLPRSNGKAENVAVTDFARWILTDGQKVAMKLGYAALPDGLVKEEVKLLD
jgi:phosphate transport system substrate-binding protein